MQFDHKQLPCVNVTACNYMHKHNMYLQKLKVVKKRYCL